MNDDIKLQMAADADHGFDDFEAQDFSAPFLVILQSNSPYVLEGNQLYISEARPGRILNTQNGKFYKECRVIPCKYSFRTVEWKPRGSGGGFVASYQRGDEPDDLVADQLTGKVNRVNGNLMQQTGYYLCLLLDGEDRGRVIVPMTSTQLKKSRNWNSKMVAYKQEDGNGVPPWGQIYRLSVVSESNSKGSWYGWRIEFDSEVTDTQLYNYAKEVHQIENFLPERLLVSMHKNLEEETM